MLNLVWLPQHSGQKAFWREFDPKTQLWIVSDTKSKFFLNQNLLERFDLINDPVKRAKEVWQDLARRIDPGLRCLEGLGTRISARDFLQKNATAEWTRRPHAPQKLIEASASLAAIATHPDAEEILGQFEEEFKETAGPLLELARLSQQFYRQCIEDKRIPTFFIPHFIVEKAPFFDPERALIFDLGFDLRDGERELIQFLSRTHDVTVLIPAACENELYSSGLQAYRNFSLGLNQVKNTVPSTLATIAPQVSLWRCSSPESEARKAVEKIREWVEAGIKPDAICVAAPRMRDYEDLLSHDLKWEGIAFQRSLNTRLSASRLLRALSARLKIMNGELSSTLLEEAFLSVAEYSHTVRRREERRVLGPVIAPEQIPQTELRSQIQNLLKRAPKAAIDETAFEGILVKLYEELAAGGILKEKINDEQNLSFIRALQKLRGEVGGGELSLALWIEAWCDVTTQISLVLSAPVEGGVWGIDLASAEECPAENIIVLGLTEEGGKRSILSGLPREHLQFFNTLGFDFSIPPRRGSEAQVGWLMSGLRREFILSCAKSDSSGRSVGASPFWVKHATKVKRDLEELDFADQTTWLEMQRALTSPETATQVDLFKKWPAGATESLSARVAEEIAGTRQVSLGGLAANPLPFTLSASRLESHWECPYKFFARSYLNLYDEADLEIEPSPQVKGQWLHAAAEKILSNRDKTLESWTDEELTQLMDTLDEVQKQISSDVWGNIRSRFVRQLRRFVDYEISWKKDHPRTTPAQFEAGLKGVMSWQAENPVVNFRPGTEPVKLDEFWAPFRGSIDRIDVTSDGRAIILDYKTSGGASSHIGTWAKKGSFQLSLYAEAVEAGLSGEKRKVIAAQYYVLKNQNRDKGFFNHEEDLTGILPASPKSKAGVDNAGREEHFEAIRLSVHEVLEKIRGGNFTPAPREIKICNTCSWRTSCRAAHLL